MTGSPSAPFQVGPYRCERWLGAGGLGEVYLAVHLPSGGQRAVKVLSAELVEDREALKALLAVVRLSMGLRHPNIVAVQDILEEPGRVCVVSDYVPGVSLAQLLARRPAGSGLGLSAAVHVAWQICQGLDHAHHCHAEGRATAVIHGALWPANVLLSRRGEVLIADFGAWVVPPGILSDAAGSMRSRLAYRTPEHLAGDELTRATDVFAVGVILYEMLAGRRLFAGETLMQTVERVEHAEVGLLEEIPVAVRSVVRRALAREPGQRHRDAAALMADLAASVPKAGSRVMRAELLSLLKDLEGSVPRAPAGPERLPSLAPLFAGDDEPTNISPLDLTDALRDLSRERTEPPVLLRIGAQTQAIRESADKTQPSADLPPPVSEAGHSRGEGEEVEGFQAQPTRIAKAPRVPLQSEVSGTIGEARSNEETGPEDPTTQPGSRLAGEAIAAASVVVGGGPSDGARPKTVTEVTRPYAEPSQGTLWGEDSTDVEPAGRALPSVVVRLPTETSELTLAKEPLATAEDHRESALEAIETTDTNETRAVRGDATGPLRQGEPPLGHTLLGPAVVPVAALVQGMPPPPPGRRPYRPTPTIPPKVMSSATPLVPVEPEDLADSSVELDSQVGTERWTGEEDAARAVRASLSPRRAAAEEPAESRRTPAWDSARGAGASPSGGGPLQPVESEPWPGLDLPAAGPVLPVRAAGLAERSALSEVDVEEASVAQAGLSVGESASFHAFDDASLASAGPPSVRRTDTGGGDGLRETMRQWLSPAHLLLVFAILVFLVAVGLLVRRLMLRAERPSVTHHAPRPDARPSPDRGLPPDSRAADLTVRADARAQRTPPAGNGLRPGLLSVQSSPRARVYLSGRLAGQTPLEEQLSAGTEVVVVLLAPGRAMYRRRLVLPKHEGKRVEVVLDPPSAPYYLGPGRGRLKLLCAAKDRRRLLISGQDTGLACPRATTFLRPGRYKISLYDPAADSARPIKVVIRARKHTIVRLKGS
ncbi:MAG: serine/threonine protein kinase [Deltaproteobacteria bacterium]|nr:serine/threonine protein kinase [Deltaproteobacteria bacterium]